MASQVQGENQPEVAEQRAFCLHAPHATCNGNGNGNGNGIAWPGMKHGACQRNCALVQELSWQNAPAMNMPLVLNVILKLTDVGQRTCCPGSAPAASGQFLGVETNPPIPRLGLGLAALGRPGYINIGHGQDLASKSPEVCSRVLALALMRTSQAALLFAAACGCRLLLLLLQSCLCTAGHAAAVHGGAG